MFLEFSDLSTNSRLLLKLIPKFFSQFNITQPVNTCSMLTIETLEQGVKYVQS